MSHFVLVLIGLLNFVMSNFRAYMIMSKYCGFVVSMITFFFFLCFLPLVKDEQFP